MIEAKSDEKDGEDSRIIEYAKKEENEQLRPYTMQEIDEMLDEAEAAFEAGEYLTNDEVFHPVATADGRPPSFSLPPSPATLKFPQKPQECREIVVYLHRRNETLLRL